MDRFVNSKDKLVVESIDASLRYSPLVARLDGAPDIKVLFRKDWNKDKVALITGGGSGHEPAHAGFIGDGMLTAVVCGEVFASPTIDAVFAAILAVSSKEHGCLLIVKNYTGDRLNFGLAAEKAKVLGYKVKMVIVGDDIALPNIAQPRGIAGTLLVHKAAGYAAQRGDDLDKVHAIATDVAGNVKSLGLALSSCTVPGALQASRIGNKQAELGLGIHGEPGAEKIQYKDAKSTITLMMNTLMKKVASSNSYCLLLNNLGATTPLEMNCLLKEILDGEYGSKITLLVGPALLMSSLDMHGFSISILPILNNEYEDLLCHDVKAVAWPGTIKLVSNIKDSIIPLPEEMNIKSKFEPSTNEQLSTCLNKLCDAIQSWENDLNLLDSKIGDGDCGSTMKSAAIAIKSQINLFPLKSIANTFQAISEKLSVSMGGSSGILFAIFFSSAADNTNKLGDDKWKDALLLALQAMKDIGGAKLGDRTMIDSLEPALIELANNKCWNDVAIAARNGADSTTKITVAKAGRASYVSSDNLSNIVDPGAEAVARFFTTLSTIVTTV